MGGQGRVDGRLLRGEQGAKGVLGTPSSLRDLWNRRQKQKESKKNRTVNTGRLHLPWANG